MSLRTIQLALDGVPKGWRYDRDGRLHVAQAVLTRENICSYEGADVSGYGIDSNASYRLLRHPDALEKAANSFRGLPILSRHVWPGGVDEHRPELVVGTTGTNARFVDPYIFCDVCIWAADAIRGVVDGSKAALSAGYNFVVDMRPGTWSGQAYDGTIHDLRPHHIALVERSRAGADMSLAWRSDLVAA